MKVSGQLRNFDEHSDAGSAILSIQEICTDVGLNYNDKKPST